MVFEVPANGLSQPVIRVISSDDAINGTGPDFRMVDLLTSAASAPFYFGQNTIFALNENGQPDRNQPHYFTDAGAACPNQNEEAYWHARSIKGSPDMHFVSIGTGDIQRVYDFEDWSGAGQTREVLPAIFSACAQSTDYRMTQLLGSKYIDLDFTIRTDAGISMDSSIAEMEFFLEQNPNTLPGDKIRATAQILSPDSDIAPVETDMLLSGDGPDKTPIQTAAGLNS